MRYISMFMFCLALMFNVANASPQTRVVAVVNGDMISSYDLEQRALPALRSMGIKATDTKHQAEIDEVYAQILEQMIEQKLLIQEAEKQGISVSDEIVEQELNARMKNMNLSKEAFYKEAAKNGLTESILKEDTKNNMLLQQLVQRNIITKIDVTEEQVQEYYAAHPEINATDFKYRVGLLIYSSTKTAEKYAQDIASGAITFKDAVRKVSVGPNVYNSGDMGMARAEDLAPSLVAIVQHMEIGETSALLNLGSNLAQINLIDRSFTAHTGELDDMTKERIKSEIRRPEFEKEFAAFTDELKEKAIIDNRL